MSSSYQTKTFVEITRERTEELRKIEARVQTLMERHGAKVGARAATEIPPLRRFEEQLQQRLGTRYPDLSPDQSKRLQERIAQAVERQKGRIVQTRRRSLDNAHSALGRAPGSQQREVYER